MTVSAELMAILACPKCKGELEEVRSPDGLGCRACKLVYPIEDDIPNFLIEEAVPMPDGGEQK